MSILDLFGKQNGKNSIIEEQDKPTIECKSDNGFEGCFDKTQIGMKTSKSEIDEKNTIEFFKIKEKSIKEESIIDHKNHSDDIDYKAIESEEEKGILAHDFAETCEPDSVEIHVLPDSIKECTEECSVEEFQFSEKNKRYAIGDLAGTFYQIPFSAKKSDTGAFHRNDIVADIAKTGDLLVMGASLRGESHYAHRIPRQDSFLIEECTIDKEHGFVVAAIADGVGNAKNSDEFSEMLVNFLCNIVSNELCEAPDLEKIDWEKISEKIWRIAVNYCYRKSGSKNIDDYFPIWASTLECVVVETKSTKRSNYAVVTISGDGGAYKFDTSHHWTIIKHGKARNSTAISNVVYCLPDRPDNIIIKKGYLQKGESLMLVTDGLSDYIEEYDDVREFFRRNLPCFSNLPEFIRVLNVAVKQMDDDKTGILISYFEDTTNT